MFLLVEISGGSSLALVSFFSFFLFFFFFFLTGFGFFFVFLNLYVRPFCGAQSEIDLQLRLRNTGRAAPANFLFFNPISEPAWIAVCRFFRFF